MSYIWMQYAMSLLLKSKTMLPKNKLIRKLKFELDATQEHLEEKLDCKKHKDSHGRSFHHGEVITSKQINDLIDETKSITNFIVSAQSLAPGATQEACDKIWNEYLSQ